MRKNLRNVAMAVLLALPIAMSAGYSNVYADENHPCGMKNPCAKGAAGHAMTGVKHLKKAIKHLEAASKAGGNEHVKQAIDHANEALKHAEMGAK